MNPEIASTAPAAPAADDDRPDLADCISEYTFRTPGEKDSTTWVRVRQTDSRSGWVVARGIEVWDGERWSGIMGHSNPRQLVHPLSVAIKVARQTIREGRARQT